MQLSDRLRWTYRFQQALPRTWAGASRQASVRTLSGIMRAYTSHKVEDGPLTSLAREASAPAETLRKLAPPTFHSTAQGFTLAKGCKHESSPPHQGDKDLNDLGNGGGSVPRF